jgi:hypothetical protein
MRKVVFDYVRKCELCQRAKPSQNMHVGLHSAEPCSETMEKLFVDIVGPLVRSKRENIVILVMVDAFTKFVFSYPVHRITAQVVLDCLERSSFPAYGTPKFVVTDNAKVFCCRLLRAFVFGWS